MKLYQWRFPSLDGPGWEDVAGQVGTAFRDLGEFDLTSLSVKSVGSSEVSLEPVSVAEMVPLLSVSFAASQRKTLERFSDIVTVKSNRSCRFIVTETGGLVRICLSNDDPVPDFSRLGVEPEDVSHLLTRTDLFDFI